MEFRISDTFTDSLTKLTGQEQKATKTTAFDLQLDPASPGMKFHKLDRAKDRNFWSVRVNDNIRLIVHRTATSLLLCYVGHHDKAYAWAERRKIEQHPKTGAAQLVVVPEKAEILFERDTAAARPRSAKPRLFASVQDDELLGYEFRKEWLDAVRTADEDTLLDLNDCLPQEAWGHS